MVRSSPSNLTGECMNACLTLTVVSAVVPETGLWCFLHMCCDSSVAT